MKSEYENEYFENEYFENEYFENEYFSVGVNVNFYGRLTCAEQRPYFRDSFTY